MMLGFIQKTRHKNQELLNVFLTKKKLFFQDHSIFIDSDFNKTKQMECRKHITL